jgi:hypothetical protein
MYFRKTTFYLINYILVAPGYLGMDHMLGAFTVYSAAELNISRSVKQGQWGWGWRGGRWRRIWQLSNDLNQYMGG